MKTKLLILMISSFLACERMEDNYSEYMDKEKVYSPKVSNLTAVSGLKEATLFWENPPGDLARKILVDYGDDRVTIDEMVNTWILTELEIKGYDVSVYTIDAFGNLSVPETTQIFPNGEE